jgi:hypothetical protein
VVSQVLEHLGEVQNVTGQWCVVNAAILWYRGVVSFGRYQNPGMHMSPVLNAQYLQITYGQFPFIL